jgi:hypothetical protein
MANSQKLSIKKSTVSTLDAKGSSIARTGVISNFGRTGVISNFWM